MQNSYIFQPALLSHTQTNIIKAVLCPGQRRIIIGYFKKLCILRNIVPVAHKQFAPVPVHVLVAAKTTLINHAVIGYLLYRNLSVTVGKAFCPPLFMMEKRMLHCPLVTLFSEGNRRRLIVLAESRTVIG